jgi:ABC-2 type transport system permease protein
MKLLHDSWLLFVRSFKETIRNPVWVFVGLLQPVFFLTLFAPLFKNVAKGPGFPDDGAMNVFIPGLLIQLSLFTAFAGFGLIDEMRNGVIERLRVTPVSRFALLLVRAGRDVLILLIQATILVLLAIPFGLDFALGGFLVTLGLLVLIGLALSAVSYALAIRLKSEDALAPVLNMVTMPVLLLSGIILPMSLAPGWLRRIADLNPFGYAVDAGRDLFNGRAGNADVFQALVIFVALSALSVWWAARSFRQATA